MEGNVVYWCSKKQNIVARSSVKTEYRAMAQTAIEIYEVYTHGFRCNCESTYEDVL